MAGRYGYATARQDWDGVWKVVVTDRIGWVFMSNYDKARGEWVTCTFGTQEQAEQAATEYNEFWKGANDD